MGQYQEAIIMRGGKRQIDEINEIDLNHNS